MGCSKSSSKREVYSNTILPQETRKPLNRQPNFTPKTTGKRTKTPKISRRKDIIKEYWSGLSCPPQKYLPDPGIEPISLMSLELAAILYH